MNEEWNRAYDYAQRGAAWLDGILPGWDASEGIDTHTLYIEEQENCILGQLGQVRVRGASGRLCLCASCWPEGYLHGVDIDPDTPEEGRAEAYDRLTTAWRRIILQRREAGYQDIIGLGYFPSRDALSYVSPAMAGLEMKLALEQRETTAG